MIPILASDFTGLLEIMIWFWGNVLYAALLLIGWLLLVFRRTRSAGISMFKPLCWAGTMLLVLVGMQYYPTIVYHGRGQWETFLWAAGISASLFLSAFITWYFLRRFHKD
ncbi:MAG: hypothetical protein IPK22_17935 [Verrucomicrobiaceae bacterium]|nr:hypothetical protein [Verrucomicrobiaceae bacterium]